MTDAKSCYAFHMLLFAGHSDDLPCLIGVL